MTALDGTPHNCSNCAKAKDGLPVPELCYHVKRQGLAYCRDWRAISVNSNKTSDQK